MGIRRVATGVVLVLAAAVPLACNQVHVGFARFQLINHTPYNITYYAVARSEDAVKQADNLLDAPLGPNDAFDADVRFPGTGTGRRYR